jgi:hypothetical protein
MRQNNFLAFLKKKKKKKKKRWADKSVYEGTTVAKRDEVNPESYLSS